MRPRMRYPALLSLLCLLSAALASACSSTCDSDLMCSETQQCNRLTRRCEEKTFPGPQSCGGNGDCADGRACVDGRCAFAPACMHLAGSWEAWQDRLTGADGGHLGTITLQQSADCEISRASSGGVPFTATVERLGGLSGFSNPPFAGAPTPCTGAFGGNETLSIQCGNQSAPVSFHLYARPVSPPPDLLDNLGVPYAPQRCTPDAGGCPCSLNAVGVPACEP
ncbi:MAG: hypothetical protein AB2A00_26350 [Myxococcota bacterium]